MASSPADAAGLEHTPARRWRTLHAHCKKGKCKVHKHRTAWLSGEDRGLRSWGSWVRVRPRALFPRGHETSSAASATCPLRHCGIPAPRSWRKPHWRARAERTSQTPASMEKHTGPARKRECGFRHCPEPHAGAGSWHSGDRSSLEDGAVRHGGRGGWRTGGGRSGKHHRREDAGLFIESR